jgi:hypothetical protein
MYDERYKMMMPTENWIEQQPNLFWILGLLTTDNYYLLIYEVSILHQGKWLGEKVEDQDTDIVRHDETCIHFWTVSGNYSLNRISKRRLDESLLSHGWLCYLSV